MKNIICIFSGKSNHKWNTNKDYFESIAPKGIQVKVKPHHGGQGYVTPTNNIAYQAASRA